MHNKKGTKINRCLPVVSAEGDTGAPVTAAPRGSPSPPRHPTAPRHRRRVTLLPPKDVAPFLPKDQSKESEAVNTCTIKRE